MVDECGDNVRLGKNVTIISWKNLKVGTNVSIHDNCYLDATGNISIGNNVSIAHATSFISFEHTWKNTELPIKYNDISTAPIIINDDVWIGCGCRILSGVQIFSRCIVAAGAIITKDCESYSIYGGIPGKKIKSL